MRVIGHLPWRDLRPEAAQLQRIQNLASPAPLLQFAVGKNKRKRKKKKAANTQYGACTFHATPLTVDKAVFFDRPPSNSRGGQGDHVVSYVLITQAVARSIAGKALDAAGVALADLIQQSATFVLPGGNNNWWHQQANNLMATLRAVNPAHEATAKSTLTSGVNNALALLNLMPGTAIKNKSSTRGHGESGSIGGINEAERKVSKNQVMNGNVWVNVLNLFDADADKSLVKSEAKMKGKVGWLMTLFSTAAPQLYQAIKRKDLTLLPDTDLEDAVDTKFGALADVDVTELIDDWMKAH